MKTGKLDEIVEDLRWLTGRVRKWTGMNFRSSGEPSHGAGASGRMIISLQLAGGLSDESRVRRRATFSALLTLRAPSGMLPCGRWAWMEAERAFPELRQVVLDCTNARALAEFYRQLLGLRYRTGDEPPTAGEPDPMGQDWLVLLDIAGNTRLAFQQVVELPEVTWPEGPHLQQMHLDLSVPTRKDLDAQHGRALTLGAHLLYDRSDDAEEPLRVYADPAGHPFCIFVIKSPTA